MTGTLTWLWLAGALTAFGQGQPAATESARPAGTAAPQPQTGLDQLLRQAHRAQGTGRLADAERLYLSALSAAAQAGSPNPKVSNIYMDLFHLYSREGNDAKSLDAVKHALALDEAVNDSRLISRDFTLLARSNEARQNWAEAEKCFRRMLELHRAAHNEASVAGDLSALAVFYINQQNEAEAERYYRQAVAVAAQLPPEDSDARVGVLRDVGHFYARRGDNAQAEALFRQALEIAERLPRVPEETRIYLRSALAAVYRREGKTADAETLLYNAVPADAEVRATGAHPAFEGLLAEVTLASGYEEQGKLEEAESHYNHVISVLERASSEDAPWLEASALDSLGRVYQAEGHDSEAEQAWLRAFGVRERVAPKRPGEAHLLTPFLLHDLYRKEGRLADIEPVYKRAIVIQEAVLGREDALLSNTLVELGCVYLEEQKYEAAVPVYKRALAIMEANHDTHFGAVQRDYTGLLQKVSRKQDVATPGNVNQRP